MLRSETKFQTALILLGLLVAVLFAFFLFREINPEYRIYQDDYVALEQFRSRLTGEPPPPFSKGVKQIVIEREDKGPPLIDRCITCHVAMEIEAFSPTRLKKDPEGKIQVDKEGFPVKEPNPDYLWSKLDEAIQSATNPAEQKRYEALKTAQVGDKVYDVTKVLRMHPLMGKETRPFEFHPVEEYGCTSCHGGNGKGLVTDKAHGPLFDGEYEEEYRGFVPAFLEKDPLNDPKFSKIFNGKPGHKLLFQTTPLLIGGLMEAKCMQCHQAPLEPLFFPSAGTPPEPHPWDAMTTTYQKGEALFVSQGCYACHRIAGISRGGVGPELTKEGESYPWFVKESIVWPQADLKTSTMPNMRLDHEEVEALLTYLLAQTGKRKILSDTAYKSALKAWEGGRKQPWELPKDPESIKSVREGMTIFALEGCAACHRLRGYDSEVGFKIEKEKPSFEALEQEKNWFKKLFPEEISGSHLAAKAEKEAAVIDEKIVMGVRKDAILEEIETYHPGAIEALYSNFKFASRAKDHLGEEVSKKWRERLHRILMMYIQEYGLGRLICPRPNWAGVYRSDEWLIEHFKNPSSRVPRSIMPVFPFDPTKFYALTFMLDALALDNLKEDRQVWERQGFNPEKAFTLYCSQCHGADRNGNGPVSHWIYPIPKNLNQAEFLQNLTKEKAILSITHGVKGTPMPSWGETFSDKPFENKEPVLTQKEIAQLVDWLFSSVPGGSPQNPSPNPKWEYRPEDVIKEMKQEGGNEWPQVFETGPSPIPGYAKEGYYIKKQYYTQDNLQAGKQFFLTHCAVCHGNEGDGAGPRAETMQEAKPQMLINVDWLSSRDDLWLLRSIKYGIPGTAMTPWGDQTSSLQRLQLVMFIRSLSEEAVLRRELNDALYRAFDAKEMTLLIKGGSKEIASLKKSKELYLKLGMSYLASGGGEALMKPLLDLIQSPKKQSTARKTLLSLIEDRLKREEAKVQETEGRLPSQTRNEILRDNKASLTTWKKLKQTTLEIFAELDLTEPHE